jgi:hypothetical protein
MACARAAYTFWRLSAVTQRRALKKKQEALARARLSRLGQIESPLLSGGGVLKIGALNMARPRPTAPQRADDRQSIRCMLTPSRGYSCRCFERRRGCSRDGRDWRASCEITSIKLIATKYRVSSYCHSNGPMFVGDPVEGPKVFDVWRSKRSLYLEDASDEAD